jgi:hypothetical protein
VPSENCYEKNSTLLGYLSKTMVKTTGPMFSVEASGSLGKAITFQKVGRVKTAKQYKVPIDRKTTAQITVRQWVTRTVQRWHDLIDSQQSLWDQYTNPTGNIGYYAFIEQYLKRSHETLPQYQLPPNHGYCAVGEWLVGELIVGGVHEPL